MNGPDDSMDDLNLDTISNDILSILENNAIRSSHFIGLSLGTVIIRHFALKYSKNVESLILAGAITKINYRLKFFFLVQKLLKPLIAFHSQFKFFTYLLLPNRNHKESRAFLLDQSRKWEKEEFSKWFRFTKKLNPLLKYLHAEQRDVSTLHVMGEEDALFLPSVKKISSSKFDSLLFIIQDCGHMVNIEQALLFNKMVIGYLVGLEGMSIKSRKELGENSKCSPEEVLIANSNNHSKK